MRVNIPLLCRWTDMTCSNFNSKFIYIHTLIFLFNFFLIRTKKTIKRAITGNLLRQWCMTWLSSVTRPGPDDGSRAEPGPGSSTQCVLDLCTGSRVWVPGHGPGFRDPAPGRARAGSRVTTKVHET